MGQGRTEKGAISWNTHSLLTRLSLGKVEAPVLQSMVTVTPLEDFLATCQMELLTLARRSSELLESCFTDLKGRQSLPETIRGVPDFLRAFRLNPTTVYHCVRTVRPGEISADAPHSLDRSGPPGGVYIPTPQGEDLRAVDVITTFADEPDWGMDQDLFSIQDYGLGSPPFGAWRGLSSQAPFHMAFLDERLMLPRIIPRLRKSFMGSRIVQFWDLADLAFLQRCPYWGWRFSSWATHYLQDLTQPYHAHPFPPSVLRTIQTLMANPRRNGAIRGVGNYLKNRHILCEAVVHFLLNDAVKKGLDHPFVRALSQAQTAVNLPLPTVMKDLARTAVSLARRIDRVMGEMINEPRMADPNYSAIEDQGHPLEALLSDSRRDRPSLYNEFVELIALCLVKTGNATRFAVERTARASGHCDQLGSGFSLTSPSNPT